MSEPSHDQPIDDPAKAPLGGVSVRRVVVTLIEFIVVGGIGLALYSRRGQLASTLDLNVLDVVAVYLLCLAAAPLRAIEFSSVTRALGVPLSFAESFALTQAATLLNYLPMQAGTVLRARVLKQKRALSYTRYVAVMSALAVVGVGSGAVDGLVALPFARALPEPIRQATGVGFGIVIGLVIVFLFLPFERMPLGDGRLARRVRELVDGWQAIKGHPRVLLTICLTTAATPLLLGLRLWICFGALELPVGLAEAVLLGAAILVSVPFNVTPGGLGVRELVGSAVGAAVGLGFAQVLAGITIDRVISLVFSTTVGGGSLAWLRRRGLA